ncbi:MAG: alcohol dehydrogenase catalytic domain-containing protein [Planctomycetota bacterium]
MASQMSLAELELVDTGTPGSQVVAVLEEPGRISTHHAKVPEPGPGQVRVKIKWVGVCGSDVEAFRGARQPEFLSMPVRLGHKVAGTIDRVGPNMTGLRPGMKVSCRYVWGAFAEYIVCEPFNVKLLPEDFPLEQVSLIEILPGVIHAAELCRIDASKTVLITGQGVSGLVLTQVISRFSPKRLAVTDVKPENLEIAKRYVATDTFLIPDTDTPTMEVAGETFPDGFDVVVPCLLEGDGMIDAVNAAAFGGKILMYGCIGTCNQPFDFFKVHRKRLEIYSTEPRSDVAMRRYFQEGVQMVLDGLVNTHEIVTDRVPLADVQRAFDLRNTYDNDTIHVLVDCESPGTQA